RRRWRRMRERGGKATVDERYTQWKSLIPVLYDWLANHNLVWPSLSCRYFRFLVLSVLDRVVTVDPCFSQTKMT
ncbi:hypothetical protein GW17_00003565, partial [Ensete ventricosum]